MGVVVGGWLSGGERGKGLNDWWRLVWWAETKHHGGANEGDWDDDFAVASRIRHIFPSGLCLVHPCYQLIVSCLRLFGNVKVFCRRL
jgi:hypothetical protein